MPALGTHIKQTSEDFKKNSQAMTALVEQLDAHHKASLFVWSSLHS